MSKTDNYMVMTLKIASHASDLMMHIPAVYTVHASLAIYPFCLTRCLLDIVCSFLPRCVTLNMIGQFLT